MSITVTLPELSPELEKQLAAMSEEERGQFVAGFLEEDPAALAVPSVGPKEISQETMARLLNLAHEPREKPNEYWRRAAENYKRLTGKAPGQ